MTDPSLLLKHQGVSHALQGPLQAKEMTDTLLMNAEGVQRQRDE